MKIKSLRLLDRTKTGSLLSSPSCNKISKSELQAFDLGDKKTLWEQKDFFSPLDCEQIIKTIWIWY